MLAGTWQSYDHRVSSSSGGNGKAGAKLPVTAVQPGGGRRDGWSLTLTATSSGRPTAWTVTQAKLAPDLLQQQPGRADVIERSIREAIDAHLNTTNHSSDMVQRGLELYKAINDSNSVRT